MRTILMLWSLSSLSIFAWALGAPVKWPVR